MTGGHGHVFPRPDGAKARCGGQGICPMCSTEYARLQGGTAEPWSGELTQKATPGTVDQVAALPGKWGAEADAQRRSAAVSWARALEYCAAQLRQALAARPGMVTDLQARLQAAGRREMILQQAVFALDAILFPHDDSDDTRRAEMREQLIQDLAEIMARRGWAGTTAENAESIMKTAEMVANDQIYAASRQEVLLKHIRKLEDALGDLYGLLVTDYMVPDHKYHLITNAASLLPLKKQAPSSPGQPISLSDAGKTVLEEGAKIRAARVEQDLKEAEGDDRGTTD